VITMNVDGIEMDDHDLAAIEAQQPGRAYTRMVLMTTPAGNIVSLTAQVTYDADAESFKFELCRGAIDDCATESD
jgi:hypothetical protein